MKRLPIVAMCGVIYHFGFTREKNEHVNVKKLRNYHFTVKLTFVPSLSNDSLDMYVCWWGHPPTTQLSIVFLSMTLMVLGVTINDPCWFNRLKSMCIEVWVPNLSLECFFESDNASKSEWIKVLILCVDLSAKWTKWFLCLVMLFIDFHVMMLCIF